MEEPVKLRVSPMRFWPVGTRTTVFPEGVLYGTGMHWNWVCKCGERYEAHDIPTKEPSAYSPQELPLTVYCHRCHNTYVSASGLKVGFEGHLFVRN